MATTTLAPASSPVRPTTIGLPNLMRSEWTKLRSLRSTYWTAIVAVIAAISITTIAATEYMHNFSPDQLEGFDAANFSVQGLYLSQIALGALGVMTITGEYATGMIRTTLTAVPQRRAVIAIKGLVYLIAMFVLSELISFASFGLGQSILRRNHAGVSLSDPNVLRVVFGVGLYLTAVGLLAFGLGALVRRTAGALAAFFGVLFLPSAVIDLLPRSWHDTAMKFAPVNAGTQIANTHRVHDMFGPWQGLGVFALYGAVIVLGALLVVGRRDA